MVVVEGIYVSQGPNLLSFFQSIEVTHFIEFMNVKL